MAKEDPLEKLAKMIDERINAAFEGRDRKAKEESDPWAKIEGLISRAVDGAVAKHFDALGEGLEEGKEKERQAGDDKPKLGILGM